MTTGDIAQVASAVFVAAAAAASWIAVAQSRKVIKAAEQPELHAQAVAVGLMSMGNSGKLAFVIHNAGGGLAKGVGFAFALDGQFVLQYVGTGFLFAGETAHVRTEITASQGWETKTRGVVFCRTRDETGYAWDLAGRRKKLGTGHDWEVSASHVWNRFHGDRPLEELDRMPAVVQRADLFG